MRCVVFSKRVCRVHSKKADIRKLRMRVSDPRATAPLNPETPSERSEPRSLTHVGRFGVSETCRACFNASPPAACLHSSLRPYADQESATSESLSLNLLVRPDVALAIPRSKIQSMPQADPLKPTFSVRGLTEPPRPRAGPRLQIDAAHLSRHPLLSSLPSP